MVILRKRGAIRLELSAASGDMPAVAVTIRPIGQADVDLATAAVSSSIVKAEEGDAILTRYGLDGAGGSAEAMRMALRIGNAMLAIELGIRHITGWEGVGTETGEAAPVEPGLIALLFNEWAPASDSDPRESYASRFLRRINGLSILEPAAKKGSAVSPVGDGAAAETPANAAS